MKYIFPFLIFILVIILSVGVYFLIHSNDAGNARLANCGAEGGLTSLAQVGAFTNGYVCIKNGKEIPF